MSSRSARDRPGRERSLSSRKQHLTVWLGGERVGAIERAGPGRMRFAYSPSALESRAPGVALLSQSLPRRDAWFSPSETRPFFEGLLPEGEARRLISRQLGLRERAEFELLQELGRDCAGAVVILPTDKTPSDEAAQVIWLPEADLAHRIDDLPRNPLGLDLEGRIRMSLAGVQPKLVLVRAVYPELAPTLAMSIGGVREPSELGPEAFATLAEQVGMSGRAAVRRAVDVSSRIASCTRALLTMAVASGWHRPVLDAIADIATERARQIGGR